MSVRRSVATHEDLASAASPRPDGAPGAAALQWLARTAAPPVSPQSRFRPRPAPTLARQVQGAGARPGTPHAPAAPPAPRVRAVPPAQASACDLDMQVIRWLSPWVMQRVPAAGRATSVQAMFSNEGYLEYKQATRGSRGQAVEGADSIVVQAAAVSVAGGYAIVARVFQLDVERRYFVTASRRAQLVISGTTCTITEGPARQAASG